MADGGEGAPSGAKTPADFLKSIKGKPVIVKLNSGVDYRGARTRSVRRPAGLAPPPARPPPPPAGTPPHSPPAAPFPPAGVLACLDGYMNIAMEQTEEYVNGQLKNKYGDCFIRGNNGGCCCVPVACGALHWGGWQPRQPGALLMLGRLDGQGAAP